MAIKPIVDQKVLLEKMQGKGGWTYARIPKTLANSNKAYGWKKINGTIDGHEVACSLMPLNKEQWFLPVNAGIRKLIKKEAGDHVQILLYADVNELHTIEEFLLCLEDDPQAWKNYKALPEEEQIRYSEWMFAPKDEETQVQRMADAIDMLARGQRLRKMKA